MGAAPPNRCGFARRLRAAPPVHTVNSLITGSKRLVAASSRGRKGDAMRLINLTPHVITVFTSSQAPEGPKVEIPAAPTGARVATNRVALAALEVDGQEVPTVGTSYGEIVGLPAPEAGTMLVVSMVVAQAALAAGRDCSDLLQPDTSPQGAVRDAEGKILGVRALVRVKPD